VLDCGLLPASPQAPLAAEPFHTWILPDGSVWTETYRTADGYLLRFPDLADFQVSPDGLSITGTPVPGIPESTTDHLYLNQVLPLALSKQGKLVFHASAVDTEEGAVVFVGESGRGKSTLAASFAVNGFSFLTDDGLVVEPEDPGIRILPSHPSIRLWSDSEEALVSPGAERAPDVSFTSKARFLAGDEIGFCNEPRPLRRVYFLGEGDADTVSFEPLKASDAMLEWVRHSFLLDVEERPRLTSHFQQVAELARLPIHYRLDFPRRYENLREVREAVLEHAGDGF